MSVNYVALGKRIGYFRMQCGNITLEALASKINRSREFLAKNKKGDAFAVLQRRIAFCLKNCKFSANTDHYKMQYSCFF